MKRQHPAILLLTGASGAGKTTLIKTLEATAPPGVACFNCDRIYHDLPEAVRADGATAQDAILAYWVAHILRDDSIRLAVLDLQIRPHRALALLATLEIALNQIVLVECEQEERNRRLRGPRGQAELASHQMECWAAYLRGQADVLGLESINTTNAQPAHAAACLRGFVDSLLTRVFA